MYVTLVFKTKGTRLTKPTISLTLLCLAMLVGVIRVAEYRNHWSDVLAGFFTGAAIAVFLVRGDEKRRMVTHENGSQVDSAKYNHQNGL